MNDGGESLHAEALEEEGSKAEKHRKRENHKNGKSSRKCSHEYKRKISRYQMITLIYISRDQ